MGLRRDGRGTALIKFPHRVMAQWAIACAIAGGGLNRLEHELPRKPHGMLDRQPVAQQGCDS